MDRMNIYDISGYITDNYSLKKVPTVGATLILDDGKFVDLNEKGHDFSAFFSGIRKQDFCFGMKTKRIRTLMMREWIFCNDGTKGGNAYIELYLWRPTEIQKDALSIWLANIKKNKRSLTVSFITDKHKKEKIFDNVILENVFKYMDETKKEIDLTLNFKSVVCDVLHNDNGNDCYTYIDKSNYSDWCFYRLGSDKIDEVSHNIYNFIYISQETQAKFIAAHDKLKTKLDSAFSGKDGYTPTKLLTIDIAYRKHKNNEQLYDFAYRSSDIAGFEIDTTPILFLIHHSTRFSNARHAISSVEIIEHIKQIDCLLLQSACDNNDLYLRSFIKAYTANLTKEERDCIYKFDKVAFFDPAVEFLDIDDISDLSVGNGRYTILNKDVNYSIFFTFDGKKHYASWYPSDPIFKKEGFSLRENRDNEIVVAIGYDVLKTIKISEKLKAAISQKVLIFEGKA